MGAVPAASLRLPSAAGPSSSVKAAALVSPVPQRRHLSSRFAGMRAARSLSVVPPVSSRRRGVVCEAHNTSVGVQEVTKDTWKSLILESSLPVLVEFWAPWCGPCKMIHPFIGELSNEYSGKLKCYQLNTDENPDVATQYGIRSIPTVMIFKNGEKKEAVIGAVPKSTLISCVSKFL